MEKILAKKPDKGKEEKRIEAEELDFPQTGRLLPVNGVPFRVRKEMFVPYQKAKLFEDLPLENFEQDGYSVKILQKKMEVFRGKTVTILLDVDVSKGGEKINISNDNRIIIFNPPFKVGNGTFRKEVVDGKEIEVENSEENIEGALKEQIISAAKMYE